MARYYRYRKYSRRFRSKGRWSANIKTINTTIPASQGSFYAAQDLCVNPSQSDSTVSQQYTVKNIELSFEIETTSLNSSFSDVENLVAYIMFVPQGYQVTETLPNTHPEWIMAYRFQGSPNVEVGYVTNATPLQPGRQPFRVKTRMARRLQTGDKVVLLITGTSNSETTRNLPINGIVRWWTKAN